MCDFNFSLDTPRLCRHNCTPIVLCLTKLANFPQYLWRHCRPPQPWVAWDTQDELLSEALQLMLHVARQPVPTLSLGGVSIAVSDQAVLAKQRGART